MLEQTSTDEVAAARTRARRIAAHLTQEARARVTAVRRASGGAREAAPDAKALAKIESALLFTTRARALTQILRERGAS